MSFCMFQDKASDQIDQGRELVVLPFKHLAVLAPQRLAIHQLAHVRFMDPREGLIHDLIKDRHVGLDQREDVLLGLVFQGVDLDASNVGLLQHVDQITQFLQKVRSGLSDLFDLLTDQDTTEIVGGIVFEGREELLDHFASFAHEFTASARERAFSMS